MPKAKVPITSIRYTTVLGERPGISWNGGFISPKKDPSMSLRPDTLVARLPRTIGLSNDRLQTLVVLIQGLINARTVNLTHLAGAFCGPAKLSSNYRRLQRFFQYVSLDEDWLAKALVALLGLTPPYRLCLDRTNWKVGRKHVNMLVLCIATQRVRIPVMWQILDYGGGSSMAQRMGLLTRFMALFGKKSIKLLLGDAEFIGNQWFEFLVENEIPFVIRVAGHLIVRLDDGYEGPLDRLLRSRATRQRLMKAKGRFLQMEQRFSATMSFGVSQLSDGSWLIVATNRGPRKALNAYKQRWQIECLFGDTKTRGFNMEDTHLTQPPKLALLLAIIALAIAWTHACAKVVQPQGDIARAKHGYRRKSWFRTGLDTLRHWIFTDPDEALDRWDTIWKRVPNRFNKPRVV
jgi:Transposase DDE domain